MRPRRAGLWTRPCAPIFGIVLLAALIFGGFWVIKSAVRSPAGQVIERQVSKVGQSLREHLNRDIIGRAAERERDDDSASRAEAIIRERYARGEIDREQYLEMLNDMKSR